MACHARYPSGTVTILRFDFIAADGRRRHLATEQVAEVLVAQRLDEVAGVVARAEAAARAGRYAAGFVTYDAAPAFDGAMAVPPASARPGTSVIPLAWFAVIDPTALRDTRLAKDAPESAAPDCSWTLHLEPEQSEADHAAAIRRVRDGIAAGDFYQVNVTQRLRGTASGDPGPRYRRLVAAEHGGYAAEIDAGTWRLLSLSPELFFRRTGRRIATRPMKGTAARGLWSEQDAAARDALRTSPKDRAENVMIVDLLRNDLGRVAVCGSVEVTELFAVEQYPTVHQMTSTIEATLRDDVSLVEIFRALFPCGSITGAPKIAAMQAIAELEPSARGVYCGTIGLIEPGGDCTFNVAIRTLVLERAQELHSEAVARGPNDTPPHAPSWRASCGVGGGITWDSVPASEHAEMLLKARVFAVPPAQPVELLETMRLQDGAVPLLERHLARMAASARYFGLGDPMKSVRAQIETVARRHPEGSWRLRAVAGRTGTATVSADALEPTIGARDVVLSIRPVCSTDVLLYHKTTQRGVYDAQAAAHPDRWDVLMMNERGELTEFTRGNLVLEIGGVNYTPPRASGLLGGVLRGELLARGELVERVLTPSDLRAADAAYFINALRGRVPVRVIGDVDNL